MPTDDKSKILDLLNACEIALEVTEQAVNSIDRDVVEQAMTAGPAAQVRYNEALALVGRLQAERKCDFAALDLNADPEAVPVGRVAESLGKEPDARFVLPGHISNMRDGIRAIRDALASPPSAGTT